jgi:hypothetical protein
MGGSNLWKARRRDRDVSSTHASIENKRNYNFAFAAISSDDDWLRLGLGITRGGIVQM